MCNVAYCKFIINIKYIINLNHYYLPGELEKEIDEFINYYNNERCHESLNNLKPVDVYNGKSFEILDKREEIKQKTLKMRLRQNLNKEYVNSVYN